MGNITELSQGSLNGLRRQLNECIENAYNKGYADGKKEPREVKAVNVEDTSDYQIGYKVGYAEALKLDEGTPTKDYTSGYNTALKDFENLYVYENDYKEFFLNVYAKPFYENVTLFDAVAKNGIEKVMDDFKEWQEQKKQVEKEIKVGDEIQFDNEAKGVVISINKGWYRIVNESGFVNSWTRNDIKKTGRNFSAEVSQLLDKLKGDK